MNINLNQYLPSVGTMPQKVRDIVCKVTNIVMNYTDAEVKVIEATNDDNWGPHGKLMQEIADLTYSRQTFDEVMGILWKRLFNDNHAYWKRTYKGLTLLVYLLKNGSGRVLLNIQEHLHRLRSLELFAYIDEKGKDCGVNVRQKVKELLEYVEDEDKLEAERSKARKLKQKYMGLSKHSNETYSDKKWNEKEGGFRPSDFNIAGRWKSTTPGILEQIESVTERVKDFVLESKNSFSQKSDDSTDDEEEDDDDGLDYGSSNVSYDNFNAKFDKSYSNFTFCNADEFSEFQQASPCCPGISEVSFNAVTDVQQKSEKDFNHPNCVSEELIDFSAFQCAPVTSTQSCDIQDLFASSPNTTISSNPTSQNELLDLFQTSTNTNMDLTGDFNKNKQPSIEVSAYKVEKPSNPVASNSVRTSNGKMCDPCDDMHIKKQNTWSDFSDKFDINLTDLTPISKGRKTFQSKT